MALGKTLAEIEQIPEAHLREYQAFYQEQPFGLWRDDYRIAQIAYILAAVNSDPKGNPPKIGDFMPFYQDEKTDEVEDDGSAEFLAQRG